jgi:hypothetical protein
MAATIVHESADSLTTVADAGHSFGARLTSMAFPSPLDVERTILSLHQIAVTPVGVDVLFFYSKISPSTG